MLFSLKYVGHDEQAVTYGHGQEKYLFVSSIPSTLCAVICVQVLLWTRCLQQNENELTSERSSPLRSFKTIILSKLHFFIYVCTLI